MVGSATGSNVSAPVRSVDLERAAPVLAGEPGGGDLGEEAASLPVEHHQVAVQELSRDAQRGVAALESLGGRGEGAVGDGDVQPADPVVDDLVEHQDPLRVGPGHAAVVVANRLPPR